MKKGKKNLRKQKVTNILIFRKLKTFYIETFK
jgi:hypothetical protein